MGFSIYDKPSSDLGIPYRQISPTLNFPGSPTLQDYLHQDAAPSFPPISWNLSCVFSKNMEFFVESTKNSGVLHALNHNLVVRCIAMAAMVFRWPTKIDLYFIHAISTITMLVQSSFFATRCFRQNTDVPTQLI